jgi:hypothetical protein
MTAPQQAPDISDERCDAIIDELFDSGMIESYIRTDSRRLIRAGYAAHVAEMGEPVAWLSVATTDKGTKLQRLGFTAEEAEMANATPRPLYALNGADE